MLYVVVNMKLTFCTKAMNAFDSESAACKARRIDTLPILKNKRSKYNYMFHKPLVCTFS